MGATPQRRQFGGVSLSKSGEGKRAAIRAGSDQRDTCITSHGLFLRNIKYKNLKNHLEIIRARGEWQGGFEKLISSRW